MVEVQRLASLAVSQVLAGRNLSHILSSLWLRHPRLSPRQRAAIQDLSCGTLRFYGQLQTLLEHFLEVPVRDQRLRALILIGLYQLQHTKTAPYAVVDHAVKTAAALNQRPAMGLVNAILRNFLRNPETLQAVTETQEVARYSHPQWWIDKLKVQYPRDYEAILTASNQHPPMTLRVNRRVIAKQDYQGLLQNAGIESDDLGGEALLLKHAVPVSELPGFNEGMVSVQDAAAQLAAPLLDMRPGMQVLDACAAPGGKSTHILELADVRLTLLDNDAERLRLVEDNLRRLKLEARVICGDAANPSDWWDGKPFQRILADVPCSASGVVRRHPDIKWLRRETDIGRYAVTQRHILDSLWQCLDIGGKLLYVTCSVFAEENGRQVDAFLERHRNSELLPLNTQSQLLPDSQHDGFFYALLRKT
ncbi:MAG TPA: 16S rRNA (cytosine(967)-C(5))-methyltransferase RsmB [Burkholderiales bacterium]|nr:16S rRNA (cytosine(967)-C(5))-methyltransferase RsmB [Burkholderiales bacterium]